MNRAKALFISGVIVLGLGLFLVQQRLSAPDSFVGDFESGDFSQWDGFSKVNTPNSKIEVVENPVRRGQYAIKVTLEPNNRFPKDRAELVLQAPPGASEPGDERYYGFSALIPEEYQAANEYFLILAQWHGNDSDLPPLTVNYQGGKLIIKGNRKQKIIWTGVVEKGRWFDMVFHVKWATGEDGLLEAWKGGEKIVELRGRTCNEPDARNFRSPGIFIKFGGYRGRNVRINQTFYLDEYRIGNSYKEVMPP